MKATWVLPDGRRITAEVAAGDTLMAAAVAAGVPGIAGACGGSLSCATCHVILDPDWAARAGPPQGFEEDMLDTTESPRAPGSRLSCQIRMAADLDGIVLAVPQG